jgi:hypothetical protein
MAKYEYILPLKDMDGYISPKTERDVKEIIKSLKSRVYSIQTLIEVFNGYSKCVKLEPVSKKNYREVRAWLLKNLALVLDGKNINPFYDVFDNVEDIMKEYYHLIKGLLKLKKWCEFPYIKVQKIDKILDYLQQFLMIDSFLKIETSSLHDIIDFIKDDISNHEKVEEETDTIESIEQDMKKWEIADIPPIYH